MDNKEVISNRQGIAMMLLFITGEASIFINGISAKSDLWLAVILAVVFASPVIIMFARLHVLFPDKNLFDIIDICFGKYLGRILMIIFIWYAFHEVVLIAEDLGFFFRTVGFAKTPNVVLITAFMAVAAYATKKGLEALGRWSELFLVVPIALGIMFVLLLIPQMRFTNILPVMYDGASPLMKGAFLQFVFPFTYVVGFTMVFTYAKGKNSPYKIYVAGLFIGGAILLVMYLAIILVLGAYHVSTIYYPTYAAIGMINIGNFLQRLDAINAIIYLIGILVEVSVFLLGTCKGIAKLFGCVDYRFVVIPVSLLAINVSSYEPISIMHFFDFIINIWTYYMLPFEVFLPFMIWLVAEITVWRTRKKKSLAEG